MSLPHTNTKAAAPGGASRSSRRDAALDIFRGIAITEVLLHHVSAFAMRKTEIGTLSHDLFTIFNRTLHFAVPAFLFIMGVLLTRTMVGNRRTWREFYSRRAKQTLVPYLIWSVIYALFRVATIPQEKPEILLNPERWSTWLIWGKAWYHLYFLVLALQLYAVFPLLLFVLGRVRIGILGWVAIGFAAQIAAHWIHAEYIRSRFPSTLLIWHVMPVLCGVWVGLHLEEWPSVWKRLRYLAIPLMLVGWAIYLPLGYNQVHGVPVHSQLYHFSYWGYTIAVAFCLLALCRWIQRRGGLPARTFQMLGNYSMAIYLVHPMLLHLWDLVPLTGGTLSFAVTALVVTGTVFGISLLVARVAARTVSGQVLFGRGDVPRSA